MAELDADVVTHNKEPAYKDHAFRCGQGPDFRAPKPFEIDGADGPAVRWRQLYADLSHICAAVGAASKRAAGCRLSDCGRRPEDGCGAIPRRNCVVHVRGGPKGSFGALLCGREWRAFGHGERELHAVRLRGRYEHEPQMAGQIADRRQYGPGAYERHGQIAQPYSAKNHGTQDGACHSRKHGLKPPLYPGEWAHAPTATSRQMRRQDQQAFEQRHRQNGDHDNRHDRDDLTQRAAGEGERGERHYRRHHPQRDRSRDLLEAAQGGLELASAFDLGLVDVLAHDHGIVDDDPQHDDQRKQRNHVDRRAEQAGNGKPAQKRYRDCQAGPEGQFQVEEQHERQKHEPETENRVPKHQIDAVAQHIGVVVADLKPNTWRQPDVIKKVAHDALRIDGALFRGTEDRNENRRLAVVNIDQVAVREPVPNGADIRQSDQRSLIRHNHGDVAKAFGVRALGGRPEQDFAICGSQRSARQIERGRRDTLRDRFKCQIEAL